MSEFKLEEECVIHVMGKVVAVEPSGAATTQAATTPAVAATVIPTTAPPSTSSPLQAALTTLRSTNNPATYQTALSTASKLLNNIIQNPMEEKYRSIKKSNAAFNKRLGGVSGGEALLLAAGFVVEDNVFVLRPSEEAWPKLVEAGEVVGRSLREAEAAATVPSAAAAGGFGASGAGFGNPMAGMPNLGPGMETAMQNMLSNPEAMQNMLNNPMVQQMMQNDPRLANNPMLQQSLQALQSNPDILRQFSSMMNDPGIRAQASRMMQQQGGSGGADPFASGPAEMRRQMEQFQQMMSQNGGTSGSFGGQQSNQPPSQGSVASGNNNNSNGGDDSQMTEEEMIAEAIARSLRES